VFAFPSTTDTFGNVVLEAHASGLPTVVSDVGGPKELVRDGVDGLVTKALDPEAFARAVEKLCTDADARTQMGAAAREKVRARDWQRAFESFWAHTSAT
jgi:glycosyltransferase involved in cell wall biosynthesis